MQNTGDAGEWEGDWDNQGPQADCDDEVRKKKKQVYSQRMRRKEGRGGLWSVPENGGECRKASERMMMYSKTIKCAFPFAKGWQGIWFRSEDGND